MTSAPVTPVPEVTPLSEPARIVDTFIAPSKTFTDIHRSAAWWGPFLITIILSLAFTYAVDAKIGFRKTVENQVERSPKASQRLEQLPKDQRDSQISAQAKGTRVFMYGLPVFVLVWNLLIATILFATFKLVLSAELKFSRTYALVMYTGLPLGIRTVIAIITLFAGLDPDAFNLQNPAPTNAGYFLNPGDSPFLYSIATSVDIFMIWTLILTAMGLAILCNLSSTTKKKTQLSTALFVVFGWYAIFVLGSAVIAAALS